MYQRIDYLADSDNLVETYQTKEDLIADATRFYHEHFNLDEDYNENFEVKTYEQALDFWQANGYSISELVA